jgi:hypothetical protein
MISMADFDWVKARADCSVALMFERVRIGVEADAKARNKMAEGKEGQIFRFFEEGDVFGVLRSDGATRHRMKFEIAGASIIVKLDDRQQPVLSGSVTLCDDGQCRIRVGEKELELWQFRCRALEALFFE